MTSFAQDSDDFGNKKVLLSFSLTSRSFEDPMLYQSQKDASVFKHDINITEMADGSVFNEFVNAFGASHTYRLQAEPSAAEQALVDKMHLDKNDPEYYTKLETMARCGIYFEDGFDYTQYLKPIGLDETAYFLSATTARNNNLFREKLNEALGNHGQPAAAATLSKNSNKVIFERKNYEIPAAPELDSKTNLQTENPEAFPALGSAAFHTSIQASLAAEKQEAKAKAKKQQGRIDDDNNEDDDGRDDVEDAYIDCQEKDSYEAESESDFEDAGESDDDELIKIVEENSCEEDHEETQYDEKASNTPAMMKFKDEVDASNQALEALKRKILFEEGQEANMLFQKQSRSVDAEVLLALDDAAYLVDDFEDDFFQIANAKGDYDLTTDDNEYEIVSDDAVANEVSLLKTGGNGDIKAEIRRHIMQHMLNAAFDKFKSEYDDDDDEEAGVTIDEDDIKEDDDDDDEEFLNVSDFSDDDGEGDCVSSGKKSDRSSEYQHRGRGVQRKNRSVRKLTIEDLLPHLGEDGELHLDINDPEGERKIEYHKALSKLNSLPTPTELPVVQELIQRYNKGGEDVSPEEEAALRYERRVREEKALERFKDAMEEGRRIISEKMDCESVVSTYSNTCNLPKLITEPSVKKSHDGASQRTKPFDALSQALETIRSQRETDESAHRARDRDETPEERKARKQLVKKENKEKRTQKKLIKTLFKEQRLKQN